MDLDPIYGQKPCIFWVLTYGRKIAHFGVISMHILDPISGPYLGPLLRTSILYIYPLIRLGPIFGGLQMTLFWVHFLVHFWANSWVPFMGTIRGNTQIYANAYHARARIYIVV